MDMFYFLPSIVLIDTKSIDLALMIRKTTPEVAYAQINDQILPIIVGKSAHQTKID